MSAMVIWLTYSNPLCSMSIGPPNPEIQLPVSQNVFPWKSMVKAMHVVKVQGHIWPWKFKVMSKPIGHIWGLEFNRYVAFRFMAIRPFLAVHSKFHIWPWKFKVKIMAKVKPTGHIWGLKFNRYVNCFFLWQSDHFGWDIPNSIFDLEN